MTQARQSAPPNATPGTDQPGQPGAHSPTGQPGAPVSDPAAGDSPRRPAAPDLLDRTWDFFSSVPVATAIIFLIAVVSVAGTLIPQEGQYDSWRSPEEYYPLRYGPVLGTVLLRLGITHMYSTWWYITLLGLFGASLTVCSLNRFVPLWRAVQRTAAAPPAGFFRHTRHRFAAPAAPGPEPLAPLAETLRHQGYRVRQQGDRLYADRGRWNRWGPYITHVGLLLILVAAMARGVPGWYADTFVWVKDGETSRVPGTTWFVRNEKFTVEYYPEGKPKLYATDAVVVDGGQEVMRHTIKVNFPLEYRGVGLYQSSFRAEPGAVVVAVIDRASGAELGRFRIDLGQPAAEYAGGPAKLLVRDYFPDFGLDEQGKPASRSGEPRNPAFRVEVVGPSGAAGPFWFFVNYPAMEFATNLPYRLNTAAVETLSATGLKVKRDAGLPLLYTGLTVSMVGLCLTFYLSHRRLWAMVQGTEVLVAGLANRGKEAFARDFAALAASLGANGAGLAAPAAGEGLS